MTERLLRVVGRSGHRSSLPGVLIIIALGAPLAAQSERPQPPRAAQQPPTFRTEVNYVEVDVRVTDRGGDFVRGLGAEEFEVLEDGKPQEISAFGFVDLPYNVRSPLSPLPAVQIESDVRSNSAAAEGRIFVIVLDDLHTHPLRSTQAKNAARQLIQQYLGPDDLVSIIHTSGRANASQEFTPDSRLVLASVESFMGRKLRSGALERLDAWQNQRGMERETRADPRMQHVFDPLDAERGRDAERLLETLERLGELLADTRGRRKSLVLISEGIDYDVQNTVAQTESGVSTFTSAHAPSVRARLRGALGALTRANVALYGIDPRGLATSGEDIIEVGSFPENPLLGLGPTAFRDELQRAQDSLRVLSEETGGVASVSSNDFADAFERLMKDASTYYVLGYHSNNARADGRFRKIDVRVKRKDVQVRARKGYLAASSRQTAQNASVKGSFEASATLQQFLNQPLPGGALPMRAFAAPFKGPGAKASVVIGLEVDARNFKFERQEGFYTNKLEAAVVAVDAEGKFLDGDRHSVDLKLRPETYEAVRANGLRLLFRLYLPPGRYQVRMAAHEAGSGAAGSVHHDIQLPDFSGDPLRVSGVVLSSTSAAAMPTPHTDPDLAALLPHPPTASRDFSSAETLAAAFAVYHDGKTPIGAVQITTSVVAEDGRVRSNSEVQATEAELRAAPDGYGYAVEIPLRDLAPGMYVLRVEAKSRAAKAATAIRELPFSIQATAGTRR